MSQHNITITGSTNGTGLITELNSWRNALHSGHSGSSRPSYVVAGMQWVNTSVVPWVLNMFDGVDDIPMGTINPSTNVYTPSGLSYENVITMPGYAKYPGGIIHNWGMQNLQPGNNEYNQVFTKTFPGTLIMVIPTIITVTPDIVSASYYNESASGFTLVVKNSTAGGFVKWLAIGI